MVIRLFQHSTTYCDSSLPGGRQIFRSQYCEVRSGFPSTPKAEERLESRHGFPPAIVPENKLVKVGLQMASAYPMVGPYKPLLEIANRAIGQWNDGLRTLAEFSS